MKYNTDKYDSGLIAYYEKKLRPFQYLDIHRKAGFAKPDHTIKAVEVGIYKGGFLCWLRDYLGDAAILYGLDININQVSAEAYTKSKAILHEVDQTNITNLKFLAHEIGEVAFVVEDGAHQYINSMNTLTAFWPYISKNGYFFIEDWAACYPPYTQFRSMEVFVKELITTIPSFNLSHLEIIHNVNPPYAIIALQK
jgi:hypothetical protein